MASKRVARELPQPCDLSAWEDVSTDPRIVTVDGPAAKLVIRRNCLIITDGPVSQRRTRTVEKVPSVPGGVKVERIKILQLADSIIAGEVFLWLRDAGIAWAMYDRDDKNPVCLGQSSAYVDGDLLRAQAQTAEGGQLAEVGIAISRRLIMRKMRGQARNADQLLQRPDVAAYITRLVERVETATEEPGRTVLEVIRGMEGDAAAEYWQAWRGLEIQWKGNRPVAAAWLSYPARRSLAYSWETNKSASDPVNAMINWCYKILETEATHLLNGACLSPALGIMHADLRKRNSMALDLMESARWIADRIVWGIIQEPLRLDWFRHLSDGTVLCNAPLTHQLANLVRKECAEMMPDVFYIERQIRSAGDEQRAQLRSSREADRQAARTTAHARRVAGK